MSWVREKSTNWNHPSHFQYDSADLPFSGEGGYLESGMPLWKINSITEVEKSFCASDPTQTAKDQFLSPLVKLLNASRHSNENLSSSGNDRSSEPPHSSHMNASENRRMSQSLPVTPLSTPAQTPFTTPAPTPYSTPAPTPQSSPLPQRKAEMEAVCKAAIRCNQRLVGEQQQQPSQQNMKWYYGFLPHGNDTCRSEVATNQSAKQITTQYSDVTMATVQKQEQTRLVAPMPSPGQGAYRRRCAPLMTNRDLNFLAPTSM